MWKLVLSIAAFVFSPVALAQVSSKSPSVYYAYCHAVNRAERIISVSDIFALPTRGLPLEKIIDDLYHDFGRVEPGEVSCYLAPSKSEVQTALDNLKVDMPKGGLAVQVISYRPAGSISTQLASTSGSRLAAPQPPSNRSLPPLSPHCLTRREPGFAYNACSQKANVTYCHLNGAFMCSQQSFGMFTVMPRSRTGTAANGAIAYVMCPYPTSATKPRFANGQLMHEGCR